MPDKFNVRLKRLLNHHDWPLWIVTILFHKLNQKLIQWLNFNGSHTFIDRSKGSDRLLVVLAGYKSFLWSLTLNRIAKFVPSDVDICILSSGLYSEPLAQMAAEHGWSYLYTKANKVSLVQNLAIAKHTKAQWIYKLDEDVFISENFCEKLLEGYLYVKKEGLYNPGFCAPYLTLTAIHTLAFLEVSMLMMNTKLNLAS